MAFTHHTLIDFIQDQLFSYQDANNILNTIRHFAEDLLGDPVSNSDLLGDIYMGNGTADGGRITFGGTSFYIGYNASNQFEVGGKLQIISPYLINHEKMIVSFQHCTYSGGGFNFWLNSYAVNADNPFVMPRAGKVVSYSSTADDYAGSEDGLDLTLYKNGSAWIDLASWATATGHLTNTVIVSDISTYTFSANDYLDVYVEVGASSTAEYSIACFVEVWI